MGRPVYKIKNKERNMWRGKKQRYSVFRARLNVLHDTIDERMVLQICRDNRLRVEDYFVDDEKAPWRTTLDHLTELGYRTRTKSISEIWTTAYDELPPLEK